MPKEVEEKQEVELTEEEKKQKEWDDMPAGGEPAELEETPELKGGDPEPGGVAGEGGEVLPVEEPPKEPPVEEPQYREIVHQGQVHRITEDKLLELAQKGFDYESKVAKIAPQRRLVELVEQYPEVATMVDAHVRDRLAGGDGKKTEIGQQEFDVKPLGNYETADEWLQDNFSAVNAAMQQANTPKAQTQEEIGAQIITALKMHDPQDFATVFPKMQEAIGHLTITEYQRVDSDLGELLKFYDAVKTQTSKAPPLPKPLSNKPPFKMPSGKLPQEKTVNSAEKIWDLPNAKFDDTINRARGFA